MFVIIIAFTIALRKKKKVHGKTNYVEKARLQNCWLYIYIYINIYIVELKIFKK